MSRRAEASAGPLAGVRVVDLTRVLSGPYCTMVLADLGATVVKVEPPGGDDTRRFPPFADGESLYFAAFNRGKQSIVLDLKSREDGAVFERLLDGADVLVENYRPGVLDRLGYGPAVLAARWPRVIHASVSGFGQTGPMAQRQGYDLLLQAMGGLMSLTGAEDGPPARVGTSVVDIGAGLFAAIGVLAALHERNSTGRGGRIDIAMLDSEVALLEHALLRVQTGDTPQRTGARFPTSAPADAYATADGWIVISATDDKRFASAMAVLGTPALSADPRFATAAARLANQAALKPEIEAVTRTQPTAHWDAVLVAANIPCGPVRTVAALLDDPQLAAREMLVDVHGVKGAGNPIKMSGHAPGDRRPAPSLDGDRAAILRHLESPR